MDLRIRLLVLFSVVASLVSAQEMNYATVDKQSYDYYTKAEWSKLIALGKKAEKADIDFYYLQYRMGIAYYSLKNYRKAIPYFEDVVAKSPQDAVAKEYLYYSYLFSDLILDASKVLSTMKIDHRDKVQFYNIDNGVNNLSLEYKGNSFDSYAVDNSVNEETVQKTRNSLHYYAGNIGGFTKQASTIDFNFSVLSGANSVYDNDYSQDIIDEDLKQYQLGYIWNKRLTTRTNMKLALVYMHESINWYEPQNEVNTSGRWDNGNNSPTLIYNESTSNFSGFLSFTHSIGKFDLSSSASIATINDYGQFQPGVELWYYPLGNANLFLKTALYYQMNFSNTDLNTPVIKETIGMWLGSKVNLKMFGMYGKVYSLIDDGGLSIYNSLDRMNYWYGANVSVMLGKKASLYMYLRNDGQTNTYTISDEEKDIDYNVKSILIGLSFNF